MYAVGRGALELWTCVSKEALMRFLILASVAAAASFATGPATAQTYDPSYPVCLHVYGRIAYYECRYTSLAQCRLSASGRSAQCIINPYFAAARLPRPAVRHRHYRDDY
jgi:hypothetical protein